jgi:hypothetical protein
MLLKVLAFILFVQAHLQQLCTARAECGLAPKGLPELSGVLRGVVAFGAYLCSPEVKRRFDLVLDATNAHLPPDVGPVEVWCRDEGMPRQLR